MIEELRQLAGGKKDKMAFDPTEPDFGLLICNLTQADASVMISSGAKICAGIPTATTNHSTALSTLFHIDVWVDYPNQVDRFYGGYGPELRFFAGALDIERFASQLEAELDALGSYFAGEGE